MTVLRNSLIEREELPSYAKMSMRTIEEEIRQDRFPKPRALAGRRVGWKRAVEADLNGRFEADRVYSEDELPGVTGIEVRRLRRLIAKRAFPAPGERGWSGAELRRWEQARLLGQPWKPGRRRSEETELYRHFDGEGRLLYVGIAVSTPQRLKGHRHKSRWFAKVATITIERFPTRAAAEAAERAAIKAEKPLHNIVHAEKP